MAPQETSSATGGHRSKPKPRAASVLDKMAPSELATVLRALLKKYPGLRPEAESIAVKVVSSPSVENLAEDVLDAVTSLGLESLHRRAGEQSWGYVAPTEAAWELLGEAVEDVIDDMKRRMDLGLYDAAQANCSGIVLGLHKASGIGSDGPLSWAPDLPAEEVFDAVAELIGACSAKRAAAQFATASSRSSAELVPGWDEMIARAAGHALNGR